MTEPLVGLILICIVLSAFGWIIYRIIRYFNRKPIKRLYADGQNPNLND